MSNNSFVPDEMQYTRPNQKVGGETTWVSYRPTEAGPFVSDQSFSINVSSTSHFLQPDKTFLKYKVSLVGGSATAGTTSLSTMSLVAPLKDVSFSLGGVRVESIRNYNQYVSIERKRTTAERTNLLKELEAIGDPTCLSASADKLVKGRYCMHALENALGEMNDALPLPFIRGGVRVEIQLDSFNNVMAGNANGHTNYRIEDVQLICGMIKPADSYMKEFQASLEAGRFANIPIVATKSYQTVLNASTAQTVDINCGFLQSLKSIMATQRVASVFNSVASDLFNNDTHAGLKKWSVQVGSSKYPLNMDINVSNDVSVATPDPTGLALAVAALSSHATGFDNKTAQADNKDCFLYYNWSLDYNNGVSVSDGKVTLTLDYNTSPTVGNVLDVYAQCDALIQIGSGEIILNERSL